MHKHKFLIKKKLNGFTIIELLVVIVIIGVLATIIIIAYSGASQRAVAASLQADLTSVAKQLKLDQSFDSNGNFPSSLAVANGGSGIEPGPDTDYQYTVDNGVNPKRFCITATKENQSFMINQKGTPESGGCSGHIAAGVDSITNLVSNPSFENASNCIWANSGVSVSTSATNPYVGSNSLRAIVPTTSPDAYFVCHSIPITPGSVYTMTYYARADTNTSIDAYGGFQENGGSWRMLCQNDDPIELTTEWRKISYICPTYGDSPTAAQITFRTSVTDGTPVYYDGVIVTEGINQTNYSDGTYNNWSWSGSANNSTSSGPIYWGENGNRLVTNYIENPIFEGYNYLDYGEWGNLTGLSYSLHDTTHVLYGTYAGRFSSNIDSGEYYLTTSIPFYPKIGKTYTFSAYVYIPVGSGIYGCIIDMRGWDSYSFMNYAVTNLRAGEWTRVHSTFTATITEPKWRLTVADMFGGGSNQQFWVDGVMLTEGSELYDYADGNTPGWVWTGPLGKSMSMGVIN